MKFYVILIGTALCMTNFSCNSEDKKQENAIDETYWQQQIRKYPDSSILQENLIQYYRDNDEYEKAISFTDSLLDADSNNAKLWHMKGVIDFEIEDSLGAAHSFEKAYVLNPNPIDAIYMARLMAYYHNPKSLEVCNEIISTFGKAYEKETFIVKGNYYAAIKENQKALDAFDSSIKSSYTYMDAYLQKAFLFMSLERYKEAIDILMKAVTVQNNYDDGYFYLGKCYEQIKDTAKAIDAYEKTMLINSNFVEADEALKRISK